MFKVIWCSHSFRQMLIAEKGIQEFTLRIPIFPRISKGLASSYLAWIGDDTLLGGCNLHRKIILQGSLGSLRGVPGLPHWTIKNPRWTVPRKEWDMSHCRFAERTQRYVDRHAPCTKATLQDIERATFCSTCWASNFCPPIAEGRRYAVLIKNDGLWANISYMDKVVPTKYAIKRPAMEGELRSARHAGESYRWSHWI